MTSTSTQAERARSEDLASRKQSLEVQLKKSEKERERLKKVVDGRARRRRCLASKGVGVSARVEGSRFRGARREEPVPRETAP